MGSFKLKFKKISLKNMKKGGKKSKVENTPK